jgi:hypothetical protein
MLSLRSSRKASMLRAVKHPSYLIGFNRSHPVMLYLLSSKVENAQNAQKMTTTRCGIRETATARNVVLWLFLNNHDAVTVNELFISLVIY